MSQIGIPNNGVFPPFTVVETLTGNIGGPVGPDAANNINVVGDGTTITIVGNPGTFTLTASTTGAVATSYVEDVGSATPALGVLNIIGGASTGNPTINMNTFGSGNTVEVRLNNSISQPTTNASATEGMYNLGSDRFMHNYASTGLAGANTFLGNVAGNLTSTGVSNTGIGAFSLRVLTTATHNTMVGSGSGASITTSSLNVGHGWRVLQLLSTGSGQNVSIGSQSGRDLLTGAFNTFIGNSAGLNYIGAESSNILIGSGVGGTAAESNTLRIGLSTGAGSQQLNRAFIAGITGVTLANAAVVTIDTVTGQLGQAAGGGTPITTITGNTGGAIAPAAGNFNIVTSGSTVQFAGTPATETLNFNLSNLVLGSSLPSLTTGTQNVGLGRSSLTSVTSGQNNVAIGDLVAQSITTGVNNIAIGAGALNACTTGVQNIAIGTNTLDTLTTGGTNTIVGHDSGSAYTGAESNNIILGGSIAGTLGESNVIRIGTGLSPATTCFIDGIDGVNVGSTAKVVTMGTGGTVNQLGTAIITAGTGVTIGTGANTITINATGGGVSWSVETVNLTGAVNHGYFANKAGTLTIALPATSAVGDVIKVININTATGTQFTQAAGQQIFISTASTTLGATGTLTSSAVGDTMTLVCRTANTTWWAESFVGAWTTA